MVPNIVLVRVDNRLIHGQVAVTWSSHVGANLIIVVDDDVAKDKTQQMLMDLAAPPEVETRYFSVKETIDKLPKASPEQKIFLVVKEIRTVVRLVENGIKFREVNIGNMHFKEGKKQISSTVSVDENDIADFKKLNELGVNCEVRRVPTEKGFNIMNLI